MFYLNLLFHINSVNYKHLECDTLYFRIIAMRLRNTNAYFSSKNMVHSFINNLCTLEKNGRKVNLGDYLGLCVNNPHSLTPLHCLDCCQADLSLYLVLHTLSLIIAGLPFTFLFPRSHMTSTRLCFCCCDS